MDNTLILYNSKTGFTKAYAYELGSRLDCPVYPWKEIHPKDISADRIVFGSRLHAGRIEALRPVLHMLLARQVPHIFMFVTGAMPSPSDQELETIWNANLSPEERKVVAPFYLPGGLRYEEMGAIDRFMMSGLRFALRHSRDDEKQAMLKAIEKSYTIQDFRYLDPLVQAIRGV